MNRAFVAFSGGGAKGLIHVGALRALEDRNVVFQGVAGTSAGAIVAALRAAGFSSREILDPDSGVSVIDRLHEIDPGINKATDIFGRGGWVRLRLFRWTSRHISALKTIAVGVGVADFAGILAAGESHSRWAICGALLTSALLVWVAKQSVRCLIGGLADIKGFRDALAILLQRRMFPDAPERVVTMSDFGRDGRPTLKVVGANLSERKLHLFSPERTPDIPVADAVAASICLPVIFRPWTIETREIADGETVSTKDMVFVDGGIVSNLPAWPFDEERELDPEALTIAVAIADLSRAPVVDRFNWLPSAIRTALFGSGELNLRASGRSEQLELESRLDLLDFDMTLDDARQEVRDGEAATGVWLDKWLFKRPDLYRTLCLETQRLAAAILSDAPDDTPGRIRVAIALPDRDYRHSLRLEFSVGYERDPDEGMLVPIEGSVLGAAWSKNESRFEVAPLPPDLDLPGDSNRLRRKMVWADWAWQVCIPISAREASIHLAIRIDGDAVLPENELISGAFDMLEKSVKDLFDEVVSELS
nr:patatin-like phospholipase family protein [Gluconacetobacter sacchari]